MSQVWLKKPASWIPVNLKGNPTAVANWMTDNAPCVAGRLPREWTQAVVTALEAEQVAKNVIREAFKIAKSKGFDFPPRDANDSVYFDIPATPLNYVAKPGMGSKSTEKWTMRELQEKLAQLDKQYMRALADNDEVTAGGFFGAALRLILEFIDGGGEGAKMRRNPAMTEWNEHKKAVDEALERAYNLRTNFRHLSATNLRDLRRWQDPEMVRRIIIRPMIRSPRPQVTPRAMK